MKGAKAGLWTLMEPLGAGGMAEVWRGSGHDVADCAIKLMPHARELDAAFHTEAAALARVVHRRIIRILDFGSCQVAGRAVPYLALELASGPSLAVHMSTTPMLWDDVLHVTRCVLEALAHAHARGLVHRDIKPANVLAMDTAGRDWRLTDFGIAHTTHSQEDEYLATGTPTYMAPEQFRGKAHEQGPWTDLYALGCVLFELVYGTPPFRDSVPLNLALAHLRDSPPEVPLRKVVPPGFKELLDTLLRKDPMSRFRCAADVLAVLNALPKVHDPGAHAPENAEIAPTMVTPTFSSTRISGGLGEISWTPERCGAPVVERPPLPLEPPESSPRYYFSTFHGDTGPGLLGLRELPFVGRLNERATLWELFREASKGARRTVGITGSPGIGKTAIGRWLTRVTDELGAAKPIRVNTGRDAPQALLNAVAEAFKLDARSDLQTAGNLEHWATAPGWAVWAITRAISGGEVSSHDLVDACFAAIWAFAKHERPVVLFVDNLDEIPGMGDVVRRCGHLVDQDVPLLVVYTAQKAPPDLDDVTIELGPFAPGEAAEVVTELVGISVEEAFEIAHLVDGHPQLAVDVVREWVEDGLLIRKGPRWALRPAGHMQLPESAAGVRRGRVELALQGRAVDREALELLACFRRSATVEQWHAATFHAGLSPSGTLVATAARSHILEVRDGRLDFVDGVTKRTLERDAELRAVATRYHAAIAKVLAESNSTDATELGLHLMKAGAPRQALPWLLDAMSSLRTGDVARRLEIEPHLESAIEMLGLTDEEAGWRLRFYRLRTGTLRGNAAGGRAEFDAIAETARERGWVRFECEVLTAAGHYLSARAPRRTDRELVGRAVLLADQLEVPRLQMDARSAAGAMCGYLGALHESMRQYREAHSLAEVHGDVRWLGEANYGIGWVDFLRGDNELALASLDLAAQQMRAGGATRQAYAVIAFRGDVLRALGRLDEADASYTEAYRYFSRYHLTEGVLPANFALLEVARGRFDDAVKWARRSREIEGSRGRVPILKLATAIELLYSAHQGDPSRWDHEFGLLADSEDSELGGIDLAYVLDAAGRETVGTMGVERARPLLLLAEGLWRRLGRSAEANALSRIASR